jgi:uncharacterized protein (DUF2384 family)
VDLTAALQAACSCLNNYGGGGGSASDVRENGGGLFNRILVAGGGGGQGALNRKDYGAGGAGGGNTAGSCGSGWPGGFPDPTSSPNRRFCDKIGNMAIMYSPDASPVSPSIALKALGRLAERWALKRRDIARLVARPERTVRGWFERGGASALDRDVLERISHLVGIYDGLHRLFGDAAYADRWIHENNAAFANRSPLELLASGSFTALVEVRRYIEQALTL